MTASALVLAPIACGVVLLVSGVAKLRDADGSRDAFAAMGVPAALRSPFVVRALPIVEIALGLLLLVTWGWVLAVVAACTAVLFAAYWVLVARVLRRGEAVDCHCFGSIGTDQVTGWTLARNTVLVVLAVLAVAYGAGGSGVPTAVGDLGSSGWAWVAMAGLVAATAALVVSPGGSGGWDEQDDEGDLLDYERTYIPFALLEDEEGRRISLRELASQRAHLLVFLSLGCAPCEDVAKNLEEWQRRLGPVVQVSAVFTAFLEALPDRWTWPGVNRWFDVEGGASRMLAYQGRPGAVLLGADGFLAGGPVAGARNIESSWTTFSPSSPPERARLHPTTGTTTGTTTGMTTGTTTTTRTTTTAAGRRRRGPRPAHRVPLVE